MSFDMYNPYKPQQPINGLLQVNGIKGAEIKQTIATSSKSLANAIATFLPTSAP